jgi:hypothetical protein
MYEHEQATAEAGEDGVLAGYGNSAGRSAAIQVFCDESKSRGFVLAGAQVPCSAVGRLRDVVNGLLLPKQVRLHFTNESAQRRKHIISSLANAGSIGTVVYDGTRFGTDDKAGRSAAIGTMAARVARIPVARVVLETDDSTVEHDRKLIRARLKAAGVEELVGCDHLRSHEEPLLAIPDAVAWCFTKGGEWRKMAEPLITDIVLL